MTRFFRPRRVQQYRRKVRAVRRHRAARDAAALAAARPAIRAQLRTLASKAQAAAFAPSQTAPTPPTDPLAAVKEQLANLLTLDSEVSNTPAVLTRDCSLADFVKWAWPVLEPEVPLVWSWHMQAICDHLEAVSDGRIRNLIINVPPRFSKSTLVSVAWPCWEWTFAPGRRFLFASYGAELSERDSRRCRRLIASHAYQTRYGTRFAIVGDKDTVVKFENTHGGFRMATSVGGVAVGEGGDRVVCDDPIKIDDGNSQTRRSAVNRWWSETMTSRLNDPKSGAKVIIMQRVHEEDLSGYLLSQNLGYEHLCLPLIYEPPPPDTPPHATAIGFVDPRTTEGEFLCPERIGPNDIDQLRAELGTEYAFVGQYQQRPAPRGGGMIRVDKLDIVDDIPQTARLVRVRAWDRAGTQGGGAYTVGLKMAWDTTTGLYYIEHVHRGQWSTDAREQETNTVAQQDGPLTHILLEQEPGSAGIDSVKATVRYLTRAANPIRNFLIHAISMSGQGDKTTRAGPFATQVAFENVKLVRGAWNREYIHELESFDTGRYRDQVDASSLAFNFLTNIQTVAAAPVSSAPPVRFQVR